jgi:hypothetical protein
LSQCLQSICLAFETSSPCIEFCSFLLLSSSLAFILQCKSENRIRSAESCMSIILHREQSDR